MGVSGLVSAWGRRAVTPSLRERAVIVKDRVASVPSVDTLLQTYARADGLRFMRWAAAIALFGYLSVFPLLVLAFIAFGAVLHRHPEVRTNVETFLHDTVPLLFDPQGNEARRHRTRWRGQRRLRASSASSPWSSPVWGGSSASIEGVRRMQGAMRRGRNVVDQQGCRTSYRCSRLAPCCCWRWWVRCVLQAAGDSALEWIGLSGEKSWLVSVFASGCLRVLAVVGPGHAVRVRGAADRTDSGASRCSERFGRASFWCVLMQFSMLVVGRTLTNPVYGTLAIAAALLLFLYLASSVMLYFAAWVAVKEGAPPTQEQIAYAARNQGSRDIQLPVAGVTDPPRTTTPLKPPSTGNKGRSSQGHRPAHRVRIHRRCRRERRQRGLSRCGR